MFRVNISVLKKIGSSGITHWRQIVLLMAPDTETYVLRSYYGRKLQNMKKEDECPIAEYAFALRDFRSLTDQRCNDGYELVEFLCAPMNTKSLAFFKPPMFSTPKGEKLHNLFLSNKRRLAIPISGGARVYVKIGHETVCSVKAIDAQGNHMILPRNVNQELELCVKLGKMECAILEGYVEKDRLMITDIAAINGMECTTAFEKRLAIIEELFGKRSSLSVCKPILATQNMLNEFDENRSLSIKYYVVKDTDSGFEQADGYESKTFILPNFYSMEMVVLARPEYGSRRYKVGLMGRGSYHAMGYATSNRPLSESETVTVNFTGMSEGEVLEAWVCEDDSYRSKSFNECDIEQLYEESMCWAGRLNY